MQNNLAMQHRRAHNPPLPRGPRLRGGLATLLVPLALSAQAAAPSGTAPSSSPPAEAPPLPSSPAAATPASTDTPEPIDDDGFKWDFRWEPWEGLVFYASQPTQIKARVEAMPLVDLQELKLAGTIGARLEVDGAAYSTSDTLSGFDDGVDLRRARITAKGASILGVPFSYRVDLGYVPGAFTVTQAYVQVAGIRYLGDFRLGQFTPPVGLQMITSSWDIGFMEPAAPLQALAPASQPGAQLHDTFLERRGTWTVGAYAGLGSRGEYGSGSKSFGNLMGRLTWLAVDHAADTRPADNRYLHLGFSANLQASPGGSLRYRSRPESFNAPYVVDTGDIDASSARGLGVEGLWVNGSFSAQGELISSQVGSDADGTLHFFGGYAQAGWFLTGESRPYNRSDGTPGRIIPLRNFGFGPEAGWGAWEAGARVSYTDLNSGTVRGGRLTMLMGTLNWTLRPQLKCVFELGAGRVSDTAQDGNLLLAQLRMGLYFY